MLKTQQDCVETYLEDCIMDTIDQVADEEARKEIQEMATKINDIAYDVENTYCLIILFKKKFKKIFLGDLNLKVKK